MFFIFRPPCISPYSILFGLGVPLTHWFSIPFNDLSSSRKDYYLLIQFISNFSNTYFFLHIFELKEYIHFGLFFISGKIFLCVTIQRWKNRHGRHSTIQSAWSGNFCSVVVCLCSTMLFSYSCYCDVVNTQYAYTL